MIHRDDGGAAGPTPGNPAHTIATATSEQDHRNGTAPQVVTWAFRPCGRRTRWLLLVPRCPYCSSGVVASAHAHRGHGPRGGVRAAGCGRGAYLLVVSARGWAA